MDLLVTRTMACKPGFVPAHCCRSELSFPFRIYVINEDGSFDDLLKRFVMNR
jgi:hypothetical protein